MPSATATVAEFVKGLQEGIASKPTALAVGYPGGGAAVNQIAQAAKQVQFAICCNQGNQPYTAEAGLVVVGQDTYSAGMVAGTQLCSLILAHKGRRAA